VILNLSGHLGTNVSALVDGQLSADEEERAWSHVLTCAGCRRRVEHEGWVKQTLSGLGWAAPEADRSLSSRVYDVHAWAAVDEIEEQSNRRRVPLALVGVGCVGLGVVGLMALTSPPASRGEIPGAPRPTLQSNLVESGFGSGLGSWPGTGTPAPGPLRRASR
jgi:anti-sigma factor RsiW